MAFRSIIILLALCSFVSGQIPARNQEANARASHITAASDLNLAATFAGKGALAELADGQKVFVKDNGWFWYDASSTATVSADVLSSNQSGITGRFIRDTASGGGGETDQNVANDNLSADGDRSHDFNSNSLTFTELSGFNPSAPNGQQSTFSLAESLANGSNKVTVYAPAALAADVNIQWPATVPASGTKMLTITGAVSGPATMGFADVPGISAGDQAKIDFLSVTQAVDLDQIEIDSQVDRQIIDTDYDAATPADLPAAKVGDYIRVGATGNGWTAGEWYRCNTDTPGGAFGIQSGTWTKEGDPIGGGDLGYTESLTDGVVTNTGGTDATIPTVSNVRAGLQRPHNRVVPATGGSTISVAGGGTVYEIGNPGDGDIYDTISGGDASWDGDIITVQIFSGDSMDNGGNISLNSDIGWIDTPTGSIIIGLQYRHADTTWYEAFRTPHSNE